MMMYASMKEFDQGISAASDFPQALHNSEQCMATLGRVYLQKDDLDNAIKWFDAAIVAIRNWGSALLQSGGADHASSARFFQGRQPCPRARKAGFPNAEVLLKDVESKVRGE